MTNARRIGLSAALACSLAATVVAQSSTPPAPVAPPDQMTTITVTGCVRRSEAVSGSQPASHYVLAQAHDSASGVTTPDAKMVTSTVSTYQLAGDEPEISKNVGHSVQITGTVDRRDAAANTARGANGALAPRKLTITTMTDGTGTCAK